MRFAISGGLPTMRRRINGWKCQGSKSLGHNPRQRRSAGPREDRCGTGQEKRKENRMSKPNVGKLTEQLLALRSMKYYLNGGDILIDGRYLIGRSDGNSQKMGSKG